jgi:hypothetical protein
MEAGGMSAGMRGWLRGDDPPFGLPSRGEVATWSLAILIALAMGCYVNEQDHGDYKLDLNPYVWRKIVAAYDPEGMPDALRRAWHEASGEVRADMVLIANATCDGAESNVTVRYGWQDGDDGYLRTWDAEIDPWPPCKRLKGIVQTNSPQLDAEAITLELPASGRAILRAWD